MEIIERKPEHFSEEYIQMFRYIGSKRRHIPLLYEFSPKLNSYHHLAVPFCGGGSYELNHPYTNGQFTGLEGMYKEFHNYSYFMNIPTTDSSIPTTRRLAVSVNDLDKSIMHVAHTMLFYKDKLLESLKGQVKSQAYFDYCKSTEFRDPFRNALRKLYIVYCSFAAKQQNWGFGIDILRDRNIYLPEEELDELIKRMQQVLFHNRDYAYFIDLMLQSKRDMFFYIDPPYTIADNSGYYIYEFSSFEDHIKVFNKAKEIDENGHRFLISYDNSQKIAEMYEKSGFNVYQIILPYSAGKGVQKANSGKELLITNYTDFAGDEYLRVQKESKSKSKIQRASLL